MPVLKAFISASISLSKFAWNILGLIRKGLVWDIVDFRITRYHFISRTMSQYRYSLSIWQIVRQNFITIVFYTWWHHGMDTLSASRVLCVEIHQLPVDSQHKCPVMHSFVNFIVVNKNKQSSCLYLETLQSSNVASLKLHVTFFTS